MTVTETDSFTPGRGVPTGPHGGGAARKMVARLGLAGLVPFFVLPVAVLAADAAWAETLRAMLVVYAATIVSFIGALHWLPALVEADRTPAADTPDMAGAAAWLVWGIVPAFLATVSVLLPRPFDLVGFLMTLLLCLAADLIAVRRGRFPEWYGRLRRPLTFAAGSALLAAVLVEL